MRSLDQTARTAFVSRTEGKLSVKRQCELVGANRSSIYRRDVKEEEKSLSHGESNVNLCLMRHLDELHLAHPAWGYRKLTQYLRQNVLAQINTKRVRRLLRKVGITITALYPKPNLSKRLHAKYVRPYLLKNLTIDHVDQVWGVDISYLPLKKGFLYLFIIIDWYSRCIVDYEVSFSLDKSFVLRCLKRALAGRRPEIINSDQGSHFTNEEYLELLKDWGVQVSMDGKGRALDNVRTERFFRRLKYEDIYIKDYEDAKALRRGVSAYIENYNTLRPHQTLSGLTPAQVYGRQKVKDVA